MLINHVRKHCTHNLYDDSTTFCATCPFEDQVVSVDRSLQTLFVKKRQYIKASKSGQIKIKF